MTPPAVVNNKKVYPENVMIQEQQATQRTEEMERLITFSNKMQRMMRCKNKFIFYSFIVLSFMLVLLFFMLSWAIVLNYSNMLLKQTVDIADELISTIDDLKKSVEQNYQNTMKAYYRYSSTSMEQCHKIPTELRFDCHPEAGASELSCFDRKCCYESIVLDDIDGYLNLVPLNTPYCYYPTDWKLYEYQDIYNKSDTDFSGLLVKKNSSFYKDDLKYIKMEASGIDEATLRFKIYDPHIPRYEPKWPIRKDYKPFERLIEDPMYRLDVDESKPGFRIIRRNAKEKIEDAVIFDTINAGGFIFANQFLQISSLLPSDNIYGLGEHRTNIKLNTNWTILTMFNKDQPPTENSNLYGSHPFYLLIEDSGNCHGVLFLNSNAMDVILQPTPAITFRSIGGIFDMYFFLGPTPTDVLRQYSDIVGKPFMPPYWSLGFHLSRFGYGSLEKTKEVWMRTRKAGIPFDTQWNDLDYMEDNNDFTYNKNKFKDLPKFVEELHEAGMHYVPLIDPGVSASEKNGSYPPYDEGIRHDIFIKDPEANKPFMGKVWNRVSTVWPDFTHPKVDEYWYMMMNNMHQSFQYDGAWIDMNEPSNFFNGRADGCPATSPLDNPPYVPKVVGGSLYTKTLCMSAMHHLGHHYDIHNTYGIAEATATNSALKKIRNKRPFVLSRATWVGQGAYSAHWTGDIYSSWYDLRMSIPEILAFSFFQMPMVGADICGFDGNTTEALCNRWMQVGAFYPFSRNHNSDDTIEQDPVALGDTVMKSSRKALMIRYRFLPYLYTLFFRAHLFGDTVARPLFLQFPNDPNTWNQDTQFLWGCCFLIIPVLEESKEMVTTYLPHGIWYDFYNKSWLLSDGRNYTLPAPIDTIPIMIFGGVILPAQTPGKTTTESRKNKFELLIAPDAAGEAFGELFWDDGDSLDSIENERYTRVAFILKKRKLFTKVLQNSSGEKMILGKIQIMGMKDNVTAVTVNNKNVKFNYDSKRSYLTVTPIEADLNQELTLEWEYNGISVK